MKSYNEDSRLQLTYAIGAECGVDLADWNRTAASLEPLRRPALFATAKLGPSGRTVEFGERENDLAADNLRNLAADALGISRRMLIDYCNGEKPIPLHIWLACVGWETRFDLDGSPAGKISPEHRQDALASLKERFRKGAARKKEEQQAKERQAKLMKLAEKFNVK